MSYFGVNAYTGNNLYFGLNEEPQVSTDPVVGTTDPSLIYFGNNAYTGSNIYFGLNEEPQEDVCDNLDQAQVIVPAFCSSPQIIKGVFFNFEWDFCNNFGVPIPLTGFEVLIQIRSIMHNKLIYSASLYDQGVSVNSSLGKVMLDLSSDITNELNFCVAHIDCYVYSQSRGYRSIKTRLTLDRGVSQLLSQ